MTSSHKSGPHSPHQPSQPGDKWQKIAEETEQSTANTQAENPEESQLEFTARRELENQLTALERQVDEYKQQTARAQAELENVRRRAERDISDAHKFGVKDLIIALFPAMEALLHGLNNGDAADPKIKPLHEGMQLTLDLLHKALTKFGVEIIDPAVGDQFDPKLHEAVTAQHQPGAQPNTIIRVLQRGYQLHGRVLRAAMVMVAS